MQRIYSYLIIGVYCLFAFFNLPISSHAIAGFLIAVTLVCFSLYFDKKFITGILMSCYVILGFFFPQLYLFFSLLLGEVKRMKLYPLMALSFVELVLWSPFMELPHSVNTFLNGGISGQEGSMTAIAFYYICLGSVLALFLDTLCSQIVLLKVQYRKNRDDSAERNFLLKERNQLLMDKQDYEIQTAMLQERGRIAREIHDNAGHVLTRCILLTGMIKTLNRDEKCKESLQVLDEELTKAMDSIRNSVHDLHRESINLKESIQDLLSDFSFCPVDFIYDTKEEIPAKIKYAFLSITTEALTNVAKHSHASHVKIRITEHPAMYQLVISDNGKTEKDVYISDTGIGLQNMKERVASLHGMIQIMRENGFRIFVSVPKTNEALGKVRE